MLPQARRNEPIAQSALSPKEAAARRQCQGRKHQKSWWPSRPPLAGSILISRIRPSWRFSARQADASLPGLEAHGSFAALQLTGNLADTSLPASFRKVFNSSAVQRTRLRRVVRGIADSNNNFGHKIFRARILLQDHLILNQNQTIWFNDCSAFRKNNLSIDAFPTGIRATLSNSNTGSTRFQ